MLLTAILLAGAAPLAGATETVSDPADATAPASVAEPSCTPATDPEMAERAEGHTYILPETGFAFIIPGEEPEVTPLPPCPVIPAPVRPRDLDIFGFHALPVGTGPMGARWHDGELLTLPEQDARVASLVWEAQRPGANPLDAINRRVNGGFRYVEDRGGDRWAAARDTLSLRQGDCEDLAILKLALLAHVGVESDRLFLVIVRDQARQTDHAVAAVRWENRLWILDNRIDRLQPAERVMDYVPLQSFSGPWAWTYGYKAGGSAQRAVRAAYPKPGL